MTGLVRAAPGTERTVEDIDLVPEGLELDAQTVKAHAERNWSGRRHRIDIGKNVLLLIGLDKRGRLVLKAKLSRSSSMPGQPTGGRAWSGSVQRRSDPERLWGKRSTAGCRRSGYGESGHHYDGALLSRPLCSLMTA